MSNDKLKATFHPGRAPLAYGPTGTPGLIEFQRTECGHPYEFGACPECVEHANRQQLTDALHHVMTRPTATIGQTVLDESDIVFLLQRLGAYDEALAGRRAS